MSESIPGGTRRLIDGRPCVYYEGYWIKCYEPPTDSLATKKRLILALTRRLFNHVEHGINMPGIRLDEARQAYDREVDPERKRVNGAMLAGALFNRAADIFTNVVELQAVGVEIAPDNALLHECGQCLLEALDLGRMVHHRNGDDGIEELWGEPFKAFSIPLEDFYESRFIKIAHAMRDIDRIADALVETIGGNALFPDLKAQVREFAQAARRKCETLRTDPVIFEVWPDFVVAGERLCRLAATRPPQGPQELIHKAKRARRLIREGIALVTHIARARVAMPKSTAEFVARCRRFGAMHGADPAARSPAETRQ